MDLLGWTEHSQARPFTSRLILPNPRLVGAGRVFCTPLEEKPMPNPRPTEPLRTEAIRLQSKGLSIRAIGTRLGKSHATIHKWLIEGKKIPQITIVVPLTPELQAIAPSDQAEFCLEAIKIALREIPLPQENS